MTPKWSLCKHHSQSADSFPRCKLASNRAIDSPAEFSEAIAENTDEFSFAYLKEAFITSLLIIVAILRGSNKDFENSPKIDGDKSQDAASMFQSNLLYRVIIKQIQTLRNEMEGNRKSAEDAEKNRVPIGPSTPIYDVSDDDAGVCCG